MNATLSARLVLIAGMAMQSAAISAETENNKNNTDNPEPVPVVEQNDIAQAEQLIEDSTEFIESNSSLEQELSDQATLEKLEKENAELDAMLEQLNQETSNTEQVEVNAQSENAEPVLETAEQVIETVDQISESEAISQEEALDTQPTPEQTESVVSANDSLEQVAETTEPDALLESEPSEITEDEVVEEIADSTNAAPYNYARAPLGEGDIFVPIISDARVFAEFVDRFPAVVNYYTFASELEVINFYTESYGEPLEQDRKRQRLTLSFLMDGIATRVVISQQDELRQVDVIQEDSI